MNKLLKLISGIIVILMMLCFIFYSQSTSPVNIQPANTNTVNDITKSPDEDRKYTIGWSVYDNDYEFFHTMQEGVLARAAELGIDVITHDQKSSTVEMLTGVNSLIEQGIDALVISPINPEAMPVIADMARKAKIPVIVVDIGTGGADVDAFIITDSFAGGSLAGEYALELIRKHSIASKNAAILKVEETAAHARRRGEGSKDTVAQNGYKIVAEITANSDQVQGYKAMKEILNDYGNDLAVVFAENDNMALGAAQAIEEAGKKGQIMVIGFNGDPAAIETIKSGLMQGTIAQQPFEMGALGTEVAYRILTGQDIIYDDLDQKELFVEIYLIDDNGEPRIYMQ